jgi:hypothetical protein
MNIVLFAPAWQHQCFALSTVRPGYFLNDRNTQQGKQPTSLRCLVFVGKATPNKFLVDFVWRISENPDLGGDFALDEIRRFQHTCGPGIYCDDDDIRLRNGTLNDEGVPRDAKQRQSE